MKKYKINAILTPAVATVLLYKRRRFLFFLWKLVDAYEVDCSYYYAIRRSAVLKQFWCSCFEIDVSEANYTEWKDPFFIL